MSDEISALANLDKLSENSGIIKIDSIRELSTLLIFRELLDTGTALTIKRKFANVENLRVTNIDYSSGLIHVIYLEFDVCEVDLSKKSTLFGKLTNLLTCMLGILSGVLIIDLILLRFFNMGGIIYVMLN